MTPPTAKQGERKSQKEKFEEAARELETDQSERAFDKIVKRIAKKPSTGTTPRKKTPSKEGER